MKEKICYDPETPTAPEVLFQVRLLQQRPNSTSCVLVHIRITQHAHTYICIRIYSYHYFIIFKSIFHLMNTNRHRVNRFIAKFKMSSTSVVGMDLTWWCPGTWCYRWWCYIKLRGSARGVRAHLLADGNVLRRAY